MKKIMFILLLLCFWSSSCVAQISSYRSAFNNYLRMQSLFEIKVPLTQQTMAVTLYRDATFPDKANDPLGSVFETNFLQITFPVATKSTANTEHSKQDGDSVAIFDKKKLPLFIIDKKKFQFKQLFTSGFVSKDTIRSELQKNTPLLFTKAQDIAIILATSGNQSIVIELPPETLQEWQHLLVLDMQMENRKKSLH